MKSKLILLAIAILLQSNIYSQKVKFKIEEIWTMGNGEKAGKEYLLSRPSEISLDSKGNIYIHEYHAPEIKKYNAEGKYISKFGRSGEGPGEFKNLVNICINKKDELVAVDVSPARVTIFNSKTGKNRNILLKSVLEPSYINQLNYNSYAVAGGKETRKDKKLFTVWSDDFSTIREQFGELTTLVDLNDKYQLLHSVNWDVTVIDSTLIVATTEWYNPISYLFRKENNNWITIPLKGFKPNRRSYDHITEKESFDAIKNGSKKIGSVSFGGTRDIKYSIRQYHFSCGIMSYGNKYIIHFSKLNNFNGKSNFGADIFSINGDYLGYYLIKEVEEKSGLDYACSDNMGNCYFIQYSNQIPTIVKYKITLN